jgi:hypothetical protein
MHSRWFASSGTAPTGAASVFSTIWAYFLIKTLPERSRAQQNLYVTNLLHANTITLSFAGLYQFDNWNPNLRTQFEHQTPCCPSRRPTLAISSRALHAKKLRRLYKPLSVVKLHFQSLPTRQHDHCCKEPSHCSTCIKAKRQQLINAINQRNQLLKPPNP